MCFFKVVIKTHAKNRQRTQQNYPKKYHPGIVVLSFLMYLQNKRVYFIVKTGYLSHGNTVPPYTAPSMTIPKIYSISGYFRYDDIQNIFDFGLFQV